MPRHDELESIKLALNSQKVELINLKSANAILSERVIEVNSNDTKLRH